MFKTRKSDGRVFNDDRKRSDQHHGSVKPTGGIKIQKTLAEKPREYGFPKKIPNPPIVYKHPDYKDINKVEGRGLTLDIAPDDAIHYSDGADYWFHVVPHHGKKEFGLEVSYQHPHVKTSKFDQYTGKDGAGFYPFFSKNINEVMDYLKNTYGVIFDNDPADLDKWARKNLTEWDEATANPPRLSAMETRRDRVMEQLEQNTPKVIEQELKNAELSDYGRKEVRGTLEEADRGLVDWMLNIDWDSVTKEQAIREIEGDMKRLTLNQARYRNEKDFGVEEDAHEFQKKYQGEFDEANRIVESHIKNTIEFIKKEMLK